MTEAHAVVGTLRATTVTLTGTDPVAIVSDALVAVVDDASEALYTIGSRGSGLLGVAGVGSGLLDAEVVVNA